MLQEHKFLVDGCRGPHLGALDAFFDRCQERGIGLLARGLGVHWLFLSYQITRAHLE